MAPKSASMSNIPENKYQGKQYGKTAWMVHLSEEAIFMRPSFKNIVQMTENNYPLKKPSTSQEQPSPHIQFWFPLARLVTLQTQEAVHIFSSQM